MFVCLRSTEYNVKLRNKCAQHIGLKFKEETNKVLHLEYSFVWC
jgi:hypothetical protein